MIDGVQQITIERVRQIREEGFTHRHDDEHTKGELARAAAVYAWPPPRPIDIKRMWPWKLSWWKPTLPESGVESNMRERTEARIHDLAKAGALIAAEIDRLQREIN